MFRVHVLNDISLVLGLIASRGILFRASTQPRSSEKQKSYCQVRMTLHGLQASSGTFDAAI